VWRLRKEPRTDGPRGSFFFKRPEEAQPQRVEISQRLLARRRVTTVDNTDMRVAYENRPEPRFAGRGLLRTHDVANAVVAVKHREAVGIICLRCAYQS